MKIKSTEAAILRAIISVGRQLMERIFVVLIFLLFLVSAYCGFIYYQYAVKIDDSPLAVRVRVAVIEEEKLNTIIGILDEKEKIQQGSEPLAGKDIFR